MSVYRVRERFDSGEWQESAGGRVYRTLGTARGIVTQMKNRDARYTYWATREYKIEQAATEWKDVS